MARPRKEGMDYFPHDVNATGDKKIEALMLLYGPEGYAFYFILLEMIYRESSFELDVSDAETIQLLSKKIGITEDRFSKILETAIKRGCFERVAYEDRRALTSNGIKKRAFVVVDKREKMRKNDEKVVSSVVPAAETTEEMPQRKGKKKESKVKVKVEKHQHAEFVTLSESEHEKLVDQYGLTLVTEMISVLDNYKGSNGKRYESDYRAILSWVVDKVMTKQKSSAQEKNDHAMRLIQEAEDRERI